MFVSVSEHLNFTRAADALGVSTSAASLQIRVLEEYLGCSLLRRDGRQVHLTEEGAALLPRVRSALEDLEAAIDDVRAERGGGVLRLSMLASFLQQWLLPRMPRFHAAHPSVKLFVHTSVDLVDFVHSEHQVAIRLGRGHWPGVQSEKLLEEWLVPVCTPALLRKYGPIGGARDLQRYPLLHNETEPWRLWYQQDENPGSETADPPRTQIDDSASIVRLAGRGEGLALARWSLVADEVATGTLALACRKPVISQLAYWFVYPRRARSLAGVAAFKAWIFAEAARFPAPGQKNQPMAP